jgi:hypothetical protein
MKKDFGVIGILGKNHTSFQNISGVMAFIPVKLFWSIVQNIVESWSEDLGMIVNRQRESKSLRFPRATTDSIRCAKVIAKNNAVVNKTAEPSKLRRPNREIVNEYEYFPRL